MKNSLWYWENQGENPSVPIFQLHDGSGARLPHLPLSLRVMRMKEERKEVLSTAPGKHGVGN